MLRRAKSVDIQFMVKGYEIGLRDGNFSESKMQINAFFANTMTHKNVHSYIFESGSAPAGYAILRKKDAARHEIMMMFVDPSQQGKGIGKKFLAALLTGPMKDSPVLCSTTQPASTRMMALLKGAGFQRKVEAADGVYWEKPNSPGAATAAPSAAPAAAPAKAPPPSGTMPLTRVALPIAFIPQDDSAAQTEAASLESATQVSQPLPRSYPPPQPPPILEGEARVVLDNDTPPPPPGPPPAPGVESKVAEAEPAPSAPEPVAPLPEPPSEPIPEAPVAIEIEPDAALETPPPEVEKEPAATQPAQPLPSPPVDFSAKAKALGYQSRQQQARQLAKDLFETLRGKDAAPPLEPLSVPPKSETNQEPTATEEDIPLLATVNVVREKMGTLPKVNLPPIDRYQLMEFNKKDLENMNVVELAALSAQLVRLARDQLEEIDRLKVTMKKRR